MQVIFYFLRKLADLRSGENRYSKAKPTEGSVKLAIKCIVGNSKEPAATDDRKLKPKKPEADSASASASASAKRMSMHVIEETSTTVAMVATAAVAAAAVESNSTG